MDEASFQSLPLPVLKVISFTTFELGSSYMCCPSEHINCSSQNTAQQIGPMWIRTSTTPFLLLQTSLPFSLFPFLKNEGEHPLHSRYSVKEGSLPLLQSSSPACREAGVRDRENGSYPVSVSSPFCPLLRSLGHRHKLRGGGESYISVCVVGVSRL